MKTTVATYGLFADAYVACANGRVLDDTSAFVPVALTHKPLSGAFANYPKIAEMKTIFSLDPLLELCETYVQAKVRQTHALVDG